MRYCSNAAVRSGHPSDSWAFCFSFGFVFLTAALFDPFYAVLNIVDGVLFAELSLCEQTISRIDLLV